MKFEVKNRFTGSVQFVAEIECADDASTRQKPWRAQPSPR